MRFWSPGLISLFVLILVQALPATDCWGTEPTLLRHAFWGVSPEKMAEFEAAYEKQVVPLLEKHGLIASSEQGRATVDSVFARLFEWRDSSKTVREAIVVIEGDVALHEARNFLRKKFRSRTDWAYLYSAPAGPGGVLPGHWEGHWRTFSVPDGLGSPFIEAPILQGRDGSIWVGAAGGNLSQYDGHTWTSFRPVVASFGIKVEDISQDREGSIWAGTWGVGVSRYDGESWTTFTAEDGLADNRVACLLQDH
ncbi:MAG: hypothetical protein O3B73_10710, partial [bacterium]|nr:hypothetical protein [bacterium]